MISQLKTYNPQAQKAADFVAAITTHAVTDGKFDSAAASDVLTNATNRATEAPVPEKLAIVLDHVGDDGAAAVLESMTRGVQEYEREHGHGVPPDLLDSAMHLAWSTLDNSLNKIGLRALTLDDTSTSFSESGHSEPRSHEANRAVVAILNALGEACPFAHYLPADINSGESRVAILEHLAATAYGGHALNGRMDGIHSGEPYAQSTRFHKCTVGAGTFTGYLTASYSAENVCDQSLVSNDDGGLKFIRGRGAVYINGRVVARETAGSFAQSGENTISGAVTIGATTHAIAGTFNPDTGEIAGTVAPALPGGTDVYFESHIDYERVPEKIPFIKAAVRTWSMFASPWRVATEATIDARAQLTRELGLDPFSEGVSVIAGQVQNERHLQALRKVYLLAQKYPAAFDFAWGTMGNYKAKWEVMMDFHAVLGEESQKMAIRTMSHGISHLYVGAGMAALLVGCPNDIFTPSGIWERPGIFRLGRLFGRYDVYYTPKVVKEDRANDTAEVLCIGRGNDVARSPVVFGEAVAGTMIPLATSSNLNTGQAFYQKNLTEVHPHEPSAAGAAIITVSNLFTPPAAP